jgi:hypothetical protein
MFCFVIIRLTILFSPTMQKDDVFSLHLFFVDNIDGTDSPDHPYCDPISNELFVDPIIIPSGQTYDKSTLDNILKWKDPDTLEPICKNNCYPNLRLRQAIENELVKHVEMYFQNATLKKIIDIIPFLWDARHECVTLGQTHLIHFLRHFDYKRSQTDVSRLYKTLVASNILSTSSTMKEAFYQLFEHDQIVQTAIQHIDLIQNTELHTYDYIHLKIPIVKKLYANEQFLKWVKEDTSLDIVTEWVARIMESLTSVQDVHCLTVLVDTRQEMLLSSGGVQREQDRVKVVKYAGLFDTSVTAGIQVQVTIGLEGTITLLESDICTVQWEKQEFITVDNNKVILGPFIAPIHRCYIEQM